MLDKAVVSLAKRRIQLEFEERKRTFGSELGRIKLEMVGNGMSQSSVAQQRLYESIEAEVRARAMLAWQVLGRIIATQTLRIDPQIGIQLKEILSDSIDDGCLDLMQEHERISWILPGSGVLAPWEGMRSFALDKVETEVDIALLGVRRAQELGEPNPTVHIYQTIGVWQTGAGSSATILHNLGQAERRQFQDALEAVEKSVDQIQGLSLEEQIDLKEVIAEAQEELDKETPNMTRLRSFLAGIATTIQTLGSTAGAYTLLKGAAALVGVSLP